MVNHQLNKPKLVAHRGYAKNYPENSLKAFSEAINCGGKFLELDVQLTKDHIPCVIHDDNLQRTGGKDISVLGSNWLDLEGLTIGEDERLNSKFILERLTSLKDFVIFLQKNPQVHAFVELKEESIQTFGCENVVRAVLNELEPIKSQCSIISFDASALEEVKKTSELDIGYVVHAYDETHFKTALLLTPDYIICNYKKIPDEDDALWPGSWEWMIYEVTDPDIAMKWYRRGINYVETMDFAAMMIAINEL